MKLYIKNMVSQRCKIMVKEELNALDIKCAEIDLGVIILLDELTPMQYEYLKINLHKSGLELLEDKQSILVESIKNVIVDMIHHNADAPKSNFSKFISEKLGYDYTYLANVFKKATGITIQQFIIINKIEKVKELILYNQLSIKEIAYCLNYSSAAHLSYQFKKITGLTPLVYKRIINKRRGNLENV